MNKHIIYLVSEDWYFLSHRLSLAKAAKKRGYIVHVICKNTGVISKIKKNGFKCYELSSRRNNTSVFNIINLPQSTIEILIALTIIYLGLEIKDLKKIKYAPWTLAFCFGLLHGLGFAGALNEIGIANENILLSLLFFNIGIEIGQILFIPLFTIFIWISYKYKFYQQTSIFTSYLLGGMGFYRFISRFIEIIN